MVVTVKALPDQIVVDTVSGGLLVPPPGQEVWSWPVALWDEWGDQIREFVLDAFTSGAVLPAREPDRCDAILPVRLALVPEPSNDYNADAVLVCPAPSMPGGAPGPAIGYVLESYLYRNAPWIHCLDDLTERSVVCHGWLELDRFNPEEWENWDESEQHDADVPLTMAEMRGLGWVVSGVRLNLPSWTTSEDMVSDYAAAHPRVTGSEADEAGAAERASRWQEWSEGEPASGPLHATTSSVFGQNTTWIVTATGVRVGHHEPRVGVPLLVDERLREQAHAALRAHGVPVETPHTALEHGFARATVVVGEQWWEIFEVLDGYPAANLPMIATFDADTGTLSAWARPHLEPVAVLLRRHGAQVRRTVWRTPPHDVRLQISQVRPVSAAGVCDELRLLPSLRPLLTDIEAQLLGVTWGPAPALSERGERQLPVWSSLGSRGECQLCGSPAFGTAPVLTFCDDCFRAGVAGRLRDTGIDGLWTDVSVRALQRLSELEFSGPPSLDQLSQLPTCASHNVPEAMLLRMLVPRPGSALPVIGANRGTRAWGDWLALAVLLHGAYRASRGTWSVATDGHLCRSMFERTVDDFLHHHRIEHEPEPHYPWHAELNTTGLRADWLLADGTFVEALGMLDDADYSSKVARKTALAAQAGIELVTLTPRDVVRLSDVFLRWLPDTLSEF